MKRNLAFIFTLLLFSGCEGIVASEGTVYDARTGKPLDSVVVKSFVVDGSKRTFAREMVTDSTGRFEASTGLTSCFPDCPDLLVEFSREDYVTLELTNPDLLDAMIYLSR